MKKIIAIAAIAAVAVSVNHKIVIGTRECLFTEAALKYDDSNTATNSTKRFNALSDKEKKAVTEGLAFDSYSEDEYKLILSRMDELS